MRFSRRACHRVEQVMSPRLGPKSSVDPFETCLLIQAAPALDRNCSRNSSRVPPVHNSTSPKVYRDRLRSVPTSDCRKMDTYAPALPVHLGRRPFSTLRREVPPRPRRLPRTDSCSSHRSRSFYDDPPSVPPRQSYCLSSRIPAPGYCRSKTSCSESGPRLARTRQSQGESHAESIAWGFRKAAKDIAQETGQRLRSHRSLLAQSETPAPCD